MQYKYLIGIDEAGRGPLAGPVSVGVACVSSDFDWEILKDVDDSKKLSHDTREEIFVLAETLKKEHKLSFAVAMVSAATIDRIGIVPSVTKAMHTALRKLEEEVQFDVRDCHVKLDGLLKAPKQFVSQETIVGGDGKEKVIGLASIVAKVTRDRYMQKIGQKEEYRAYTFGDHKGYGTKSHREAIVSFGLSDMHRKYYCRKLLED